MRRQTVSACALVALLVASTVAATVPAAATAAPQPSQAPAASAASADHLTDRQFNDTAYLAVDSTDDGGLVGGGQSVDTDRNETAFLGAPNGTLARFGPDGETEWTVDFANENATRVLDVLATDDGVYFVVAETPTEPGNFDATEVRLGHVTGDGDVTWQRELDATFAFGNGDALVDTDDGVAVAHRVPERGVRLAEYAGGTVVWNHTFAVDARVRSLRATDDGFMLAGTAGFDEPWLARTTESGQPTLNRTYPGVAGGSVLGAVPTEDGGALLVGRHHPSFGPTGASTWTARVDGDGAVRRTRIVDTGDEVTVRQVFDTDDGLLLVGQSLRVPSVGETTETRFIGVDADGTKRFDESVSDVPRITAATRDDGTLTVAGVTGISRSGFTGTFGHVSVPDATAASNATLAPDVGLHSGETVWRGQNVRVSEGGPGETYELVSLPGDREDAEQRVVRRFPVEDGEAVLETATLPEGEYALRGPDGEFVAVEDGRVDGPADRADASFRVEGQRFFDVETDRTFVDVAEGEDRVSITVDSERRDYDVYVTADRFRGEAPSADELRAAFGDAEGFEGVETVDGRPAARIHVGDDDTINATVGEFDAGLYDLVVSGVDTRDGGAVGDTRVVVGTETSRPLGLEVESRSLTLTPGATAATNVTVTDAANGLGAIALSANRTGDPAVHLRLDADIDGTRGFGSGRASRESMRVQAVDIDGNTSTGAVTLGPLRVEVRSFGRESLSAGNNTVTLRVDWAVDEDGVPYTVPEPVTVTVTVTDAGNATGASGQGGASGESGSGSGGASGGSAGGSDGS